MNQNPPKRSNVMPFSKNSTANLVYFHLFEKHIRMSFTMFPSDRESNVHTLVERVKIRDIISSSPKHHFFFFFVIVSNFYDYMN